MNRSNIVAVQKLLGVDADGVWGPKTQAAFDLAVSQGYRIGLASSFADPADVASFRRCKAAGGSDQECFKTGDNGVGAWGDDCSEGSGISCAIPPDDMIALFGSIDAAHMQTISVETIGHQGYAVIKDRMPWKRHITNGAVIDCNPDLVEALGEKPPMMIAAKWRKV